MVTKSEIHLKCHFYTSLDNGIGLIDFMVVIYYDWRNGLLFRSAPMAVDRSVARNQLSFRRESEQPRVNRFDDLFAVAARQIGAADAAGEERVPGNDHLERHEVQAHRTLRVAGGVDHLGRVGFEADLLTVDQAFIGRRGLGGGDSEPGSLLVHHLEQRKIIFVEENWRAGEAFELECTAHVIDMGVSDENLLEFEAVRGETRGSGKSRRRDR